MIQVKICGITRVQDAIAAVKNGASMVGYNFYERSARYLPPPACRNIQGILKAEGIEIKTVGVFVNASVRNILDILETCDLDLAQLSGDEAPSLLAELGDRAFKVLRPQALKEAMEEVAALPARNSPPVCLLDAYEPGRYGGTGKTGDWGLASALSREMPILLAGGLTTSNIAQAVRSVHPWGVDVASGVERSPGIKDPDQIRDFIQYAQDAANPQTPG